MVDSLAIKMHNLAISPINYNSNQTIETNLYAIFSNTKYSISDLYINSIRINLSN